MIMANGWKYYNHALLPTMAPHKNVDTKLLQNGEIWQIQWGGQHYLHVGQLIGIAVRKRNGGIA